MTLNIGGGFSLLRCASSMVSSLCCAIPPNYAPSSAPKSDSFRVRPFPGQSKVHPVLIMRTIVIVARERCNAARRPWGRITVVFHGLGAQATAWGGVLDDTLQGA